MNANGYQSNFTTKNTKFTPEAFEASLSRSLADNQLLIADSFTPVLAESRRLTADGFPRSHRTCL
ncbi:MAG TPA: hypothetical protein VL486_13670 [Verrucomicrobiae bacterium]|nr:hypothetical protein [Verrucomicrobiae bacterium]